MKVFAFVLLIATFTVPAYATEQELPCPEALVVLPEAVDIDCRPYYGTQQVSYRLKTEYPASESIGAIGERLRNQGWLALVEDVLNPGLPSSHVDGWSRFGDATVNPPQTVHQWIGSWVNLDGEIVTFVFRYTYPEGGEKQLNNLKVAGIFEPAEVVKARLADLLSRRGNKQ